MNPALAVRLVKRYTETQAEFSLNVEFQVPNGFTILFGPSGSGKTTILDCIAGIVSATSGRVTVSERVLFDTATAINVPVPKRRVGYVFQDLALFPHLTVLENVDYGLANQTRDDRRKRSSAILETFRIDALTQRKIHQVSGGERQRVALARTLVTEPAVLLLDEPLSALDIPTKSMIVADLRAWNAAHNIPILYVTHSRNEVFALGELVIVVEAGRVIAQGTPHEVLGAPHRETVAQLAGFENIFDAVVESTNPDRGTMTCALLHAPAARKGDVSQEKTVQLETPLVRGEKGTHLRVGIRAGDILLGITLPIGLSARNILSGVITLLEQRDVIVSARVDCGVEMEVHVTLAARDALELGPGKQVWLVIKTHSCQLMQ